MENILKVSASIIDNSKKNVWSDFDINVDTTSQLTHSQLEYLLDITNETPKNDRIKVVVFRSKTDYIESRHIYKIDYEKPVYITNKNAVICYLESDVEETENNTENPVNNEPTDTEENK
jgi:hypothetical protein